MATERNVYSVARQTILSSPRLLPDPISAPRKEAPTVLPFITQLHASLRYTDWGCVSIFCFSSLRHGMTLVTPQVC